MADHECPAHGCERLVDNTMLACGSHWYAIPKDLRDAVWRTYRRGLGAGSPEHAEAVLAAVASLKP
jgi:hypothetical protein